MLPLVPWHEPAVCGDHPPPRQAVPVPQDVPDGPGGAGMPGLLGHFAVGHHVSRPEPAQDGEHVLLERHRGSSCRAEGKTWDVLLLAVPVALLLVMGLLALAARLERSRTQVLVRFTLRSKVGPDTTEHVIAKELAALLEAEGLSR